MNIKKWKWIKENGFCNEPQGRKSNVAIVLARTINFGIRHVIGVHPGTNYKTVALTVEMDVTPALSALTDRSVFIGRHEIEVARFTNMLLPPLVYQIQRISVFDDHFQGAGWGIGKKYALETIGAVLEDDVYNRFLPWFEQRSTFEQLVKLLEEGDVALQKEINERYKKMEDAKNIFQKLFFSQKKPAGYLSDIPSDGVAYPAQKEALLSALYYQHHDMDKAQHHTNRFWEKMLAND